MTIKSKHLGEFNQGTDKSPNTVTSMVSSLAMTILEENRLKGRPICIPSLNVVINGDIIDSSITPTKDIKHEPPLLKH